MLKESGAREESASDKTRNSRRADQSQSRLSESQSRGFVMAIGKFARCLALTAPRSVAPVLLVASAMCDESRKNFPRVRFHSLTSFHRVYKYIYLK